MKWARLLTLTLLAVAHGKSTKPAADPRPALLVKARKAESAASRKLKLQKQVVLDAARAAEAAAKVAEASSQTLREARQKVYEYRLEWDRLRVDAAHAAADEHSKERSTKMAQYERQLRFAQWRTLALLFLFTFMNGLARRSLSSAGPSFVAEGLMTEKRADEIFLIGFEAFAVGKFLVVPMTLLLGFRRSLLAQIATSVACFASYLIDPSSDRRQLAAWVIFRIASAMATSTILPFVGAWFPRRIHGRVIGLLLAGYQAGYLFCSFVYQRLLFRGVLHWTRPIMDSCFGFALVGLACARWLRERPPAPSDDSRAPASKAEDEAEAEAEQRAPRVQLGRLLHKVSTRWVFWAMIIAAAAYTPAVEYSTHVTSYLKEMASDRPQRPSFVCIQSTLCEGRYRGYVFALVAGLLTGSFLYDRATQLDRAFLVVGLLLVNVGCWVVLALAEPDAPAAAWVKTVGRSLPYWWRGGRRRWRGGGVGAEGEALPIIQLSGPTKSTIAAVAAFTMQLPSTLPTALFSLDFGKEGAAVLSGLITVAGSISALMFLKSFPSILRGEGPVVGLIRAKGWYGVHMFLASVTFIAALAIGAVMFSDSRKFSRGYVIRSSLLDETVVKLHACARCARQPMWRPGQRRAWGPAAGWQFRPHAPSSVCHTCGRGDMLVECSVDEAAAAVAVRTPFDRCGAWIREEKALRRSRLDFDSDPTKYSLVTSEIDTI